MPDADRSALDVGSIAAVPAVATWAVAWLVGGLILGPPAILLAGGDLESDLTIGQLGAAAAVSWLAFLVGAVWASRRFGTGDPAADLGLRMSAVDLLGVPVGVGAQLAIPVLYAPLQAIWPDTFSDERLEENARDLADQAAGATTVLLVAIVVIGAPVVEEVVYRGLLQRAVGRRIGPVGAWLAVSALFALVHLRPIEYPGLFVAGLVFGAWVLATGRLAGAIASHAAFNAVGIWSVLS